MLGRVVKNVSCLIVAAALCCFVLAGCGGGGGGCGTVAGDTTAPTLAVAYPQSGALVSDVDFRNEAFYIQISYTDSSPVDMNSLNVTLKMDDDAAQDITSYFQKVNDTTIKSSGLYAFNRTLFELASNDHAREMTVNVTAKDTYKNAGSASGAFTVYPDSPPSQ